VREWCGWGNTQLKVHLQRLEELEYLLIHRGGRGQSIVYELLYDGDLESGKHLMGLIDIDKLGYDEKKSGVNGNLSGSSRPQVGGKSPPGRGGKNGDNPSAGNDLEESDGKNGKKGHIEPKKHAESYRNHTPALGA
jgi:hypothetical protein